MKQILIDKWKEDEAHSFKGWDFSYLDNRWSEETLPWDYKSLVLRHLKTDDRLLDMGTGGGEFLLTLNHDPNLTYVTEAYDPNYTLCKEVLEPLGITVMKVKDDDSYPCLSLLPFEDDQFDIIINRHESYNPAEVKRVLKKGGLFITQQVGGKNNIDLSTFLLGSYNHLYEDLSLDSIVEAFNDFDIVYNKEAFQALRFYDVGAIVYFAKIIEWEFPGFSVDSTKDKLFKMHEHIVEKGYYESLMHRLIVIAKNNKYIK